MPMLRMASMSAASPMMAIFSRNARYATHDSRKELMTIRAIVGTSTTACKKLRSSCGERINESIDQKVMKPIISAQLRMLPRVRLRSEEHTSELQSRGHIVCRHLLETKNTQ